MLHYFASLPLRCDIMPSGVNRLRDSLVDRHRLPKASGQQMLWNSDFNDIAVCPHNSLSAKADKWQVCATISHVGHSNCTGELLSP
jgi:hypothetical protein